jgi:hypothetical protein
MSSNFDLRISARTLPLGGECDCFGEVFTAAYDRAADCNSIHDNVENGRPEVAGREANQADRALAPHQLERLRERRRRHRGHHHPVRASAGLLENLRRRVGRFGVDRHLGARCTSSGLSDVVAQSSSRETRVRI